MARVFLVHHQACVPNALARLLVATGFDLAVFSGAEQFLPNGELDAPGGLVFEVEMRGIGEIDLQHALATNVCLLPIIFLTSSTQAQQADRRRTGHRRKDHQGHRARVMAKMQADSLSALVRLVDRVSAPPRAPGPAM